MPLEVSAKFILTGSHFSPDEITDSIGIQPTQTWLTGDPIQRTALRRKHDGWCLASHPAKELELSKLVKQLLDALEPCQERILQAKRKYNLDAEICCVVYIEEETPVVHFSSHLIDKISKLGASIDLDIIILEDD